MVHLIVEYEFSTPITDDALARMSTALGPCMQARKLRRIRTVISLDRLRGYCEFEAPDAESVREAYRTARIPFRAVWAGNVVYQSS
jgi:hypothetical protein